MTPLEAMSYFVRTQQQLLTWLPQRHRRTLCLMQTARRCRVRAYLEQGVRPHINLYRVRYTNAVLACSTHLIGQPLLIYMNADDLRCVRAFLADGTELGVLEAQGAWGVKPHNLKLRQEILKLHGDKSTLGTKPTFRPSLPRPGRPERRPPTSHRRCVRSLRRRSWGYRRLPSLPSPSPHLRRR
jgi:putative transposase